jgi:hypothetical protein
MVRKLGLFGGFALTKYCVDVSNIVDEQARISDAGHLLNVNSLPLNSKQRSFFVEFCKQCWKAEFSADEAAEVYGVVFLAFGGTYPVEGCAWVTENGELILNTNRR